MKPRYFIIGAVITIVAAYLLNSFYDSRYRQDDFYKTQWALKKQNQYYDYVVLGASHAYVGFDIGVADSISGLKGINIALDGSLIGTQSVLADLYFNHNKNKAKYLFFCIDNPVGLNSELLADIGDGRMMPYLNYDEAFDFYKQYGKKWYFDRYVPFWKYAEYNYYWGPHAMANTWTHMMKHDFDTASGSRYDFGHLYDNTDSALVVVDYDADKAATEYKYFKKILQICKQNNIKPVLFTLPLTRADSSEVSLKNIAAFQQYCKSNNLDFVYLGHYLNYQFDYFSTRGHLNKKGAELSTRYFIDSAIQQHFIEPKAQVAANN
ncbi:MAG: hypothetical protein QM731_23180 [Chitinophagaceae bacterium]